MTIQQLQQKFTTQLVALYSQSEASYIAKLVLEKILEIDRNVLNKHAEDAITQQQSIAVEHCLNQLLLHTPLQYVVGQTWFYNCRIDVNQHVLIPRPETEELVEWILQENQQANQTHCNLLDIGTGSGCIPIALKKHLPLINCTAIDISTQALQIAEQNAKQNEVNIEWKQINILLEKEWTQLATYDIIVSNPPYIPENEKEKMAQNVVLFEPALALFVPNNNPQLFYEKIAAFGRLHLKKEGKIYVEVHEDFAMQTMEVFDKIYKNVVLKKDISQKQRMIMATQYH